jgi:hypothetical protein
MAEKNIYEALRSDDPRRRDAASMFTIRNSHRARRRGWITSSTSAAELSVSMGANAPGEIRFRWRCDEDDLRDAEAAEAERLRDEGKTVVSIEWDDPDGGKTIDQRSASRLRTKTNIQPLPRWSGHDADLVALPGQRGPRQGPRQNQPTRHSNSYGGGRGLLGHRERHWPPPHRRPPILIRSTG